MKSKLFVLVSCILIAGSALLVIPSIHAQQSATNSASIPAGHQHPAMHAALRYLQQAQSQLASGTSEFGGHRRQALKSCEEAIKEVEAGLKYAEEKH